MSRKRRVSTKAKARELSDAGLCDIAKQKPGVTDACLISPSDVETAAWVRLKCQFGCGGYGLCLVCPPFTPTPEQMRKVLDAYQRAILIHFDSEADVKATIAELERDIFLRGAWKAFGLGAGPCYFCKERRRPNPVAPTAPLLYCPVAAGRLIARRVVHIKRQNLHEAEHGSPRD